jgi:hypothetical protein
MWRVSVARKRRRTVLRVGTQEIYPYTKSLEKKQLLMKW